MGGVSSWLSPKEDLGPWGSPPPGQGRQEPVSVVLSEAILERWTQDLKKKSTPEVTGSETMAEVIKEVDKHPEPDTTVFPSKIENDEPQPSSDAVADMMKLEDPSASASGILHDNASISTGGEGDLGQDVDEKKNIGDTDTPTQTPFSLASIFQDYENNGLFPFRSLVEHEYLSKMDEDQDMDNRALSSGRSSDNDTAWNPESGDMKPSANIDFGIESYLLKDPEMEHGIESFGRRVPPFISEFGVDEVGGDLKELINTTKDFFSKLPEVEAITKFTQSVDGFDKDKVKESLDKLKTVGDSWTKKLDSGIDKVATKLESDMDQFLQRAERVKDILPPLMKNPPCSEHYERIAECYRKNDGQVFKCNDLIKAFSNAVGRNDWTDMKLQN